MPKLCIALYNPIYTKIFAQTMRRSVRSMGSNSRTAHSKPFISTFNREKCLGFALKWSSLPKMLYLDSSVNITLVQKDSGILYHFRANSRRFSRLKVLMNGFLRAVCELCPILLSVLRMVYAEILVWIGLYRVVHNFGARTLGFFPFRSG